jgi:hypothetical protein
MTGLTTPSLLFIPARPPATTACGNTRRFHGVRSRTPHVAPSTGGDDGKEPITAPLPWALALGGAVGELQCIGMQCM